MKKLFLIGLMFVGVQAFSQSNCEVACNKYLEMNPDVKQSGMNPWEHYTNYGKKEGRVWYECTEMPIQPETKLPESIPQENLTIVKGKDGKTLTMSFKVTKPFGTKDIEDVKKYIHCYYSLEGYNGYTPQITHKGDNWTFVFNK